MDGRLPSICQHAWLVDREKLWTQFEDNPRSDSRHLSFIKDILFPFCKSFGLHFTLFSHPAIFHTASTASYFIHSFCLAFVKLVRAFSTSIYLLFVYFYYACPTDFARDREHKLGTADLSIPGWQNWDSVRKILWYYWNQFRYRGTWSRRIWFRWTIGEYNAIPIHYASNNIRLCLPSMRQDIVASLWQAEWWVVFW